jgi:hypothetical protein
VEVLVTAISACVDCGTTILGERPRCPACQDRHVDDLVPPTADDDVTAPRPRGAGPSPGERLPDLVARWALVAEVLAIVGLAAIFVARGCS